MYPQTSAINRQPTTGEMHQLVLVTDQGYLNPTLFTLWGVLRHLSIPINIHFWGNQLSDNDWINVKRVAALNIDVSLFCQPLSYADFKDAKKPLDHISVTAMGRLFIPSRMSGRVLYIDGDTHIIGDISKLFTLDMQKHPIAAVRDYLTTKWFSNDKDNKNKVPARIQQIQSLLSRTDVSEYFNSGVLLIDTDAIRAEPRILDAMQDIVKASACPMGDQDHLNSIFYDRTLLLNPAYNSTWNRAPKQRALIKKLPSEKDETEAMNDVIIHFIGPAKPWKAPRYDLWKRRARAVWRYRRDLREFRRQFPDIDI